MEHFVGERILVYKQELLVLALLTTINMVDFNVLWCIYEMCISFI